ARGQLTFDVTARGAVFDGGVRLGERQIDVAADRLESVLLPGIEAAFDLDVSAHGVELRGAQSRFGDRHVTAHGVPFKVADVTSAVDVAADRLQAHGTLHVLEPHVTRDCLDLDRSMNALDGQLTTHGLRVDRAFGGHGDVEVDTEALATEEIEPAAFLLVQVRLHEKLVAALLHPHLEVLQQPLRAILAARADALARDDPDLAGRAGGGDRGLPGHVPHLQARRLLEAEALVDRLGVALATDVTDKVANEGARELAGIEFTAIDLEGRAARAEFDPV